MKRKEDGSVVIIAGGRDYEGSDKMIVLARTIDESGIKPIAEIVSGACGLKPGDRGWARGADGLGERYAAANGIRCTQFYATEYGSWPWCGPKRNEAMAEYAGPNGVLIALPGGKGTRSMIAEARKHGLKVYLV